MKLSDKVKKPATVAPHLIVEARAGTGKTTTLIEGLKLLFGQQPKITPSPQQKAVWDALILSKGVSSVAFVAFNKSIAEELKTKVPAGVEAMTMHSMGMKAVNANFDRLKVDSYRLDDLISEAIGKDIRQLRQEAPEVLKATKELVNLAKMNLLGLEEGGIIDDEEYWEEVLSELCTDFDIDTGTKKGLIFRLVPQVLNKCLQVSEDKRIDFSDMIWLPVALNLPVKQFDLLLVDESQDLNRCQQELARKAGKRLILVGDPKQAIYGFAGADSQSMNRMYDSLKGKDKVGCVVLPLTVTRRCGKAIVEEARKIVHDFSAHEGNPEGKISEALLKSESPSDTYHKLVNEGDMVICRGNAVLISQCFKFIRMGRKANIQGKDIGRGLVTTIHKCMKGYSRVSDEPESLYQEYLEFLKRLDDWRSDELRKEQVKRNPNEARMIAIEDRYLCLYTFAEGKKSLQQIEEAIDSIFTDTKDSPGIKLSSIHKAKGLEAKRVFFLMPQECPCPHPMAKTPSAKEQEWNLRYVGITRAIEELVYVY